MTTKLLIWLTFILVIFGLVMISSAGIYLSQKNFRTNYYYFNHQLLFGFLPGLFLFLAAAKIDYKIWKKFSLPLIILSVGFLILVFVPGFGISIGGAKRWVNFFNLFSFQPTEILKLTLIIYLASWFSSDARRARSEPRPERRGSNSIIPFLIVLFVIGIFLASQPDIGTLSIIVAIALIMFFVSGVKFKYLAGVILLIAISFSFLTFFSEYRFNRVLTLINKDFDIRGIGYHLNQSLITIGKGGLTGLGFGKGEQKFGFLPEPVSDSIFAIIGEELGFIGMVFTVALFLVFVVVSFNIAKKTKDKFASLYAVGIASWVGIQSFINIASLSGLVPLTGIPLPFISYGGTSLAVLMAATGILVNIGKKA